MWLKQRINTIFPTDYELEIMGSGICETLESVPFPTPPPPQSICQDCWTESWNIL